MGKAAPPDAGAPRSGRERPGPPREHEAQRNGKSGPALGARHRFQSAQPVLPVSDVSRAARWFCEVLGFELEFIAGEPPSYAQVKQGVDGRAEAAAHIRLWQCGRREGERWLGEVVIQVGFDIDGLHAAYVRRGVSVIEPPVSQPWGQREFAIREPDGHVLRFCGAL